MAGRETPIFKEWGADWEIVQVVEDIPDGEVLATAVLQINSSRTPGAALDIAAITITPVESTSGQIVDTDDTDGKAELHFMVGNEITSSLTRGYQYWYRIEVNAELHRWGRPWKYMPYEGMLIAR